MNNNSIKFTKKYLKYKYKYITLKDQLFFTYDTKIKQIGGEGDYVCVIDDDGSFNSLEACLGELKPPASYGIEPQLYTLWPAGDEGRLLIATKFGCDLTYSAKRRAEAESTLEGQKKNKRRDILTQTFIRFEQQKPDSLYYHRIALGNLIKWAKPQISTDKKCIVEVVEDDWGVVAQKYTMQYGKCFAVLNMANGYSPGGGYTSGAAAQEENMFRRTDCHFSLRRYQIIENNTHSKCKWVYTPEQSALINGVNGFVYLDMNKARVCIRGPEDYTADDLGYKWLKDDEIFPFYELRAAAVDLSIPGSTYNHKETCKRVAAQLDTLKTAGVRHVVLSAFGCGAFKNPPDRVALAYRGELQKRCVYFDVVVFAIFYAGYGPNNFDIFNNEFKKWDVS